jgi:hypothetical protein
MSVDECAGRIDTTSRGTLPEERYGEGVTEPKRVVRREAGPLRTPPGDHKAFLSFSAFYDIV